MEAVLGVRTAALVCFVGMLVVFYRVEGAWRLRGVVALYILRTALMNCTYPVEESILMDYVPKNKRARWKSSSENARARCLKRWVVRLGIRRWPAVYWRINTATRGLLPSLFVCLRVVSGRALLLAVIGRRRAREGA